MYKVSLLDSVDDAVCLQIGRVVHKVFLGGGACFSSPCIDLHRGLVYAATLQGTVAAVDKVTFTRESFA